MTIKQIAIGALAGGPQSSRWPGGWRARIDYCPSGDFSRCRMRQLAASDSILIGGLTVALVGAIVLAVVLRIRSERLNRSNQARRAAKRAESSRLLP